MRCGADRRFAIAIGPADLRLCAGWTVEAATIDVRFVAAQDAVGAGWKRVGDLKGRRQNTRRGVCFLEVVDGVLLLIEEAHIPVGPRFVPLDVVNAVHVLQKGGETLLEFSAFRIDKGVPEDYFSQRYLQRGV